MIDVAKLMTLREVIARGSMSAAGEVLGLTQPAVSRQVSLLERRIGTQLVRRSHRGVQATEAGRLLADHATVVRDRLALAEAQITELVGLRRGHVRIGYFFTAFAQLAPQVVAHVDASHPDLTLDHTMVDRPTALRQLGSDDLDIAIVFEHDFEPDLPPEWIEVVDLFEDPVRVLLPVDHPCSAGDTVRLDALAGDTWIRPDHGSASHLLDHVLADVDPPPPTLPAGSGDEPVECQVHVAAGQGVMLAHALNVIINPAATAVRPLSDQPSVRRVQAAVLAQQRAPAVLAVLEVLGQIGAAHR